MPVGSNWLGDDHPTEASRRSEQLTGHRQASVAEAIEQGWYYRVTRSAPLTPDTRRCMHCGQQLFDPVASA